MNGLFSSTIQRKIPCTKGPQQRSSITIQGRSIGCSDLFLIAGPCSIESLEQMEECALIASQEGVQALRGGAFKPRTSPYEFQGLGKQGLTILSEVAKKYNLLTVSEAMDIKELPYIAECIDIVQIGSRNMQNFSLLKELGNFSNPILLKRGFSATYQELLLAAEYIISAGNPHVLLCERGIRSFETYTRNTLDLNAVPALKELTHLPIFVDPSHGTGRRSLVLPMARAAVAAGADGIMVEMHPHPDLSITDAGQTIDPETFRRLVREVRALRLALEPLEKKSF
ncbi:MAG: 3-deoxy-7-phosphoheptulonate synthase [Verrucomicrobiota bacterium]|nr:3-deoxy-7-phosphoheptulonate synthase [Verrucomicrobiota bacterium]